MEFIYAGKKDHELDEMAKPENLVKAMPHYKERLDAIAEARRLTDYAAESGPNGIREAGYYGDALGSNLKCIARIPEALLTVLLRVEPDLVTNTKSFYKWLKKHPEFRAYSPGSKL